MKRARDIVESLEFATIAGIALAGINMIWGIFLLPWGVVGWLFALLNIIIAFSLREVKRLYILRNYEKAHSRLLWLTVLGFLSGFLIYGYYLYRIYSYINDILLKKYLVRSNEKMIHFAPPYIPKK